MRLAFRFLGVQIIDFAFETDEPDSQMIDLSQLAISQLADDEGGDEEVKFGFR